VASTLITGGNKGLGREAARRLIGLGHTSLNGNTGHQTVQEGTDAIVRLATIGPDGPTGTFLSRTGPVPW
jgi:NAD(P)-dependent dehydrogenase (short-subunit alcohol dehydrogenase family)